MPKLTTLTAFESDGTNLDPLITDTNLARDIYYTELLVEIPPPTAP